MTKLIITCILLTALSLSLHAQIFNQKATQKKYLIEQIAALRIYGEYLQKGYKIVQDGTTLIGDIKDGDFGIHKGYFESLDRVNPTLLRLNKVKAILTIQETMIDIRRNISAMGRASDLLNTSERASLSIMLSGLTAASNKDIDELMLILTDQKLELKDDERLQKIDELYTNIKSQYGAELKLYKSIQSLTKGRKSEEQFIKSLKRLYEK